MRSARADVVDRWWGELGGDRHLGEPVLGHPVGAADPVRDAFDAGQQLVAGLHAVGADRELELDLGAG